MSLQLEPPPSHPWSADVKVWREHDASSAGASIPHSVILHSADGFNFGYDGSGPADLALNILNAFVPPSRKEEALMGAHDDTPVVCNRGICSRFALRHHQDFKRDFIAKMTGTGGTIPAADIEAWIAARRQNPSGP